MGLALWCDTIYRLSESGHRETIRSYTDDLTMRIAGGRTKSQGHERGEIRSIPPSPLESGLTPLNIRGK